MFDHSTTLTRILNFHTNPSVKVVQRTQTLGHENGGGGLHDKSDDSTIVSVQLSRLKLYNIVNLDRVVFFGY